ncbi:hypothetical protein [Chryseobacterium sp. 18068]|uniref:hypothetical protein n=1 Tax=Chryseobacterium sp. 18068 TaxID=2681414 RepID=UPI00135B9DBC|nr:hypothetical protein [Chryseobacterium sp. 18068]
MIYNITDFKNIKNYIINFLDSYTPTGDILTFPKEIIAKMLENQVELSGNLDIEVFEKDCTADNKKISGGFFWEESTEGFEFWHQVIINKDYSLFFERHPDRIFSNNHLLNKQIILNK